MSSAPTLAASAALRASTQLALVLLVSSMASIHEAAVLVLALAICGPVFVLCELGLRTVLISMPLDQHRVARRLRLLTAVAAVGLVVPLAATTGGSFAAMLLAVASLKAVDGISDVSAGTLQVLGKLRTVTTVQAANLIGSATVVGAVLAAGGPALVAVWGSVGVSLGCAVLSLIASSPGIRASHPRSPIQLLRLALRGLPLGVSGLLAAAFMSAPQVLLAKYGSSSELVLFNLLTYLLIAAELVLNGFSQSMQLSYRRRPDPLKVFIARSIRLAAVLTLMTACGLAIGRGIVMPVLGLPHDFGNLEIVILSGCVAASSLVFCGSAVIYSQGRFRTGLAINVVSLAATCSVGLALISHRPLAGALTAMLSGVLVRATGFFGVAVTELTRLSGDPAGMLAETARQ